MSTTGRTPGITPTPSTPECEPLVLTFRATLADDGSRPSRSHWPRLRKLLKALLRGHGFKLLNLEGLDARRREGPAPRPPPKG